MKLPNPSIDLPAQQISPTGASAMWTHCLAIAAARRTGGHARLPHSTLRWGGSGGWQLEDRWDLPAQELFKLLKPLLDVRPDGRPWVIGQLGQSLDGCIATRTGDSHFVNGHENLTHLHRLRALCDTVIVGVGTAVIDNPQLTTRLVPGPNPVRVLFDPQLQLADYATTTRVLQDTQAPTLWLCDARWQGKAAGLAGAHRVLGVPNLARADGPGAVAAAVAALHALVSRFLAQGCLDRLHLAIAPLIIGNGRPGLRFTGADSLGDCPRPPFSVYPMGRDQLWDLDLAPRRAAP